MSLVIRTENLSKSYGERQILTKVNLTVQAGEVYGFLGRNGAGKTTLIRLLLGLSKPDRGTITMPALTTVGFLPDVPSYPTWMRAEEFLHYCGSLSGLKGKLLHERTEMVLSFAGLSGERHKIVDFSRGMRQRLGMAQALLHAPELLIMDEPTSALDPIGRREVLDMITSLKGYATVFFSTHLLDDAQKVCDRVGILHQGRLVVEESVDKLCKPDNSAMQLIVSPTAAGWHIDSAQPVRRSLEDAFMDLTGVGA